MIDKIVKLLEKGIPKLLHLLTKAAILSILLGIVGYVLVELDKEGISVFKQTPISNYQNLIEQKR